MSVSNVGVGGVVSGLIGLGLLLASAPAVAQRGQLIQCESSNSKFNRCQMPWRDAELVQQKSSDACIRGQSWGVDRQGLWVDRGCRGVFGEARDDGDRRGYDQRQGDDQGPAYGQRQDDDQRQGEDQGDGWRPGPGWNRQIRLQCDSHQKSYQMCQVDVGRRGQVRLVQQMSDARCIKGSSWGWNRAGVWVDHGCRAQFVVDRRW